MSEPAVPRDHASGTYRWGINGRMECVLTGRACDDGFDCRTCAVARRGSE